MLDQTLLSGGSTEPQSDRSTEIKVLQSGLSRKASGSKREQESDSENRCQKHGCRSDQQSRVNVQPDLKYAVENDPKSCLKPAKTRTLESGLGSDLKLECGLDPGSISEEIVNTTPDLEPESLSELRIESPSESDVVAPYEPAVAENLQPGSSITQTTNLWREKGPEGTSVLHPSIKSNVTFGSEFNLMSPLEKQETQEPETLSKSNQRPGPFSLSEQNLKSDTGSYQRIKSDIRSNTKALLQSSKTLRSGSVLGDKNLKLESSQNKIRNDQSKTGDCKTIVPQSGIRSDLLSDPSAEDKGDAQPRARSREQVDVQTGLNSKSPEFQPNSETTLDLKNHLKSAETETSKTGPCKAEFLSGSGETSNVHLKSDFSADPEAGLRVETPSGSSSTLTGTQKSPVDTKDLQPDPQFHYKEFRTLLSERGSNQRQRPECNDPLARPELHQEEKPASRPKEASPVDTGIFRAEPGSQVRIASDQSAGRMLEVGTQACLLLLVRVKMQLCQS